MSNLIITWQASTVSAYGLYAVQIMLQYLRRGDGQIILTQKPAAVMMPALDQLKLLPFLNMGEKIAMALDAAQRVETFDGPALHACGNDFAGFKNQNLVRGTRNVACAAFEHLAWTERGRENAKHHDAFIASSRWNEGYLKSLGLAPVHLCHQGIDTRFFHPWPLPGGRLWRDRFLIFSGGKFEFRKGQDIMTAAFKRFRVNHPEALLVAAWQSSTAPGIAGFPQAGHCYVPPELSERGDLKITEWLTLQGLPEGSYLALPFTHNIFFPQILRECNAAIFPSRAEGATNLVAMEAMACGVPTYVSANTGHKDLINEHGVGALHRQPPVKGAPGLSSVEEWGETDPDEIVEVLERIYTETSAAKEQAARVAHNIKAWDWAAQNEKLLKIVCD